MQNKSQHVFVWQCNPSRGLTSIKNWICGGTRVCTVYDKLKL